MTMSSTATTSATPVSGSSSTSSSLTSSPASSTWPPVSVTVTESRLPTTPLAVFLFILYFPLGCGLAIVRFLLAFQIFLFSSLWPLPFGRLRNYLLRVMCSYLLGVWIQEERQPPPPPPPPELRRHHHRRRHHLNKTLQDHDDDDDDENEVDVGRATNEKTPPPPPLASSSSASSSSTSSSPKVYVANSLTVIDGAAVCLVNEKLGVLNTLNLNPLLCWLFGYRSLQKTFGGGGGGRGGGGGGRRGGGAGELRGSGIQAAPTPLEWAMEEEAAEGRRGLLVFPEMTSTNGNGVVKFEEKMVCCRKASTTAGVVGTGCEESRLVPLQPISIRFRRYPIDFPYSTLDSSPLSDFFWLLWCPINVFTVEILDEIVAKPEETPRDFASRAQLAIATNLKVPPLPHGHLDRQEYVKRRLRDISRDEVDASLSGTHARAAAAAAARRRRQRLNDDNDVDTGDGGNTTPRDAGMASRDAAIEIMVEQVKTVLPQVPTSAIRRDVGLTRDVDVSITRFLEGVVAYVAEQHTTTATTTTGKTTTTTTASLTTTSENPASSTDGAGNSLSDEIGAASFSCSSTAALASPGRTPSLAAATTPTPPPHLPPSPHLPPLQFAKTSESRQNSFAERKKILIEKSREKYLKRAALTLSKAE